MTPRYFPASPRAVWIRNPVTGTDDIWLDTPKGTDSLGKTVFEPERPAVDTGLLDKHDLKLMRAPEQRKIGFRQ